MIKEYSRILKYDFPSIPILGSLLLLFIWINDPRLVWFMLNSDGKPEVSVVATTVIFLGTAGLFTSQLISFALFDQFFNIRHGIIKSPKKRFNDTTEEWFHHICRQLVPISREILRDGDHKEDSRRRLNDLSQGQVHAALHALEINCRDEQPELASQIEQFYSIYVTFSILGLTAVVFIIIYFINTVSSVIGGGPLIDVLVSREVAVVDILICLGCFIAAIHARRFKEYLRLKLLNSSRLKAVECLSKWYQVELPTADSNGAVANRRSSRRNDGGCMEDSNFRGGVSQNVAHHETADLE